MSNPDITAPSQIIDKIRKLLALSQSPNEHEAALAAARARELLQRHNLALGIVEHAEEQKAEQAGTEFLGVRIQPHIWILASACDAMFDTGSFRQPGPVGGSNWRRRQFAWKLVFVGLKTNVEAALVTFGYLRAAVDALARQRAQESMLYGASESRDYKLGAADRITEEIARHKHRMTDADPAAVALVKVGRDVARRAMEDLKLSRGGGFNNQPVSDRHAYGLGHADGVKVNPFAARTSKMLEGRS
jgi:hypothetical protein